MPPAVVGTRGPRPVTLPAGEPSAPEFAGVTIRKDLEAIVGIARESMKAREIGSGQINGRIAGFPSGAKTAAWSADQFRRAGIADVKVQSIAQDPASSFWMPLEWEVKLLGDPAFGAGSTDVVLTSAMPLSPTQIPGGELTAPLVYVGNGSPAVLSHIDVKGKIAVQLVIPQAHMFERDSVVPQAQALMKRGAIAVVNLMRQPGNEKARDFSNCGGPCVNVGGHDGHFLESRDRDLAIARRLHSGLTDDRPNRDADLL